MPPHIGVGCQKDFIIWEEKIQERSYSATLCQEELAFNLSRSSHPKHTSSPLPRVRTGAMSHFDQHRHNVLVTHQKGLVSFSMRQSMEVRVRRTVMQTLLGRIRSPGSWSAFFLLSLAGLVVFQNCGQPFSAFRTSSREDASEKSSDLLSQSGAQLVHLPWSDKASLGQAITFNVVLANAPAGREVVYEWLRDGQLLKSQNSNTLLIGSVSEADFGLYTVSVYIKEANGVDLKPVAPPHSFELRKNTIDQRAPAIEVSQMDVHAARGSVQMLRSQVSGWPQPSITWYKDGKVIADATSNLLLLDPVTTADEGVYYLEATNSLGKAKSRPFLLSV